MFGSPTEDGRVVGSGSPPRENGKVDREIGLPPVLAANNNGPHRGGGGKEAGVTVVRNASQRLADEKEDETSADSPRRNHGTGNFQIKFPIARCRWKPKRAVDALSTSSYPRGKRRKQSREEPAHAPTADDDEDDAISSPGHPPVLRLSARAPPRRCSRSHPLQPEIGYRDWSTILDRKLRRIIDALQTKHHESVYSHRPWSRGGLFLALPTIVQSTRVCRVSRRRLDSGLTIRVQALCSAHVHPDLSFADESTIDWFAISNSKYTCTLSLLKCNFSNFSTRQDVCQHDIFVKTNVRLYASGLLDPTVFLLFSVREMRLLVEAYDDAALSERSCRFFQRGIHMLSERWEKVMASDGHYFE
ncbi:hypothetical protein ALC53_10575 [Atta colombica]|uniref:Uncharacterized protein n=1 Tax=Atta colombica TaxID=520822 RepID=A0A195B3F6_9HYME|nr:hypothetical protein ALC53_10575 [Atta colombica]